MSVTLSDEEWGRVEAMSQKLKLTQATIIRLAINAGIAAVEISQNPDWERLFAEKLPEKTELMHTHKK